MAQHAAILEQATQALLDQEVQRALAQGALELDGDLSPRRVSNSSQTYPEAEYGYMSGRLQLGYQAAVISMRSPTYGRLGLSASHHSGKTVLVTQAEGLALEAERRLGRRPLRRTDLLAQRLEQMEPEMCQQQQKVAEAQQNLLEAKAAQAEVQQQGQQTAQELAEVEAAYQQSQRPERPNSHLAKVRHQAGVYPRRLERRRQAVLKAQEWLGQQQTRLAEWEAEKAFLSARWQRFQAENACNLNPIQAILRLDADFGEAGNPALLIEMGYEVYSKPYGNWLSGTLTMMSEARTQDWQKVGKNAEMLAWKAVHLEDFPYGSL